MTSLLFGASIDTLFPGFYSDALSPIFIPVRPDHLSPVYHPPLPIVQTTKPSPEKIIEGLPQSQSYPYQHVAAPPHAMLMSGNQPVQSKRKAIMYTTYMTQLIDSVLNTSHPSDYLIHSVQCHLSNQPNYDLAIRMIITAITVSETK
ncbi:MAG: hypothetical protein IPJ13_01595 [Saprospiraceae bacterium]|nr:hypothetical protein [Saprospiraceae bacterium]